MEFSSDPRREVALAWSNLDRDTRDNLDWAAPKTRKQIEDNHLELLNSLEKPTRETVLKALISQHATSAQKGFAVGYSAGIENLAKNNSSALSR